MSSLTPAQEPTSTWRSSMSVCPTVSMTLLSWIETPLSPPPPPSSPRPFSSPPPSHLLFHLSPLPRPDCLLSLSATPSLTLPSTVSSSICAAPWTFHEVWPVKHLWSSSVLPSLLICSPCFQRIDEPGYVVAEGRESCWLSTMAAEFHYSSLVCWSLSGGKHSSPWWLNIHPYNRCWNMLTDVSLCNWAEWILSSVNKAVFHLKR